MQQAQLNYRTAALIALLVLVAMGAGKSAYSAGIAQRGAPDPILSGDADGPCDPHTDSPNHVAGTDVYGNRVAPADLKSGDAVPVPPSILVPLHGAASTGRMASGMAGESPAIELDGKKLAPLLQPAAACPAEPKSAH